MPSICAKVYRNIAGRLHFKVKLQNWNEARIHSQNETIHSTVGIPHKIKFIYLFHDDDGAENPLEFNDTAWPLP